MSRWVVYYTCKTFFHYLLTNPYKIFFSLSKSRKIGLLFHPVEHNSRPLGSVNQSKNYTEYTWTWKFFTTFGVYFKFLTSLVFWVYGTQKLGNKKKCQKIRLLEFNSCPLHSVDHFEILISLNLETFASPHNFFDFLYFI